METFLAGQIYYSLTAAADFLEQLVIAKFSRSCASRSMVVASWLFVRADGLSSSLANAPRPAWRRQPGQPPSGASAGISAPHFPQTLIALITAPFPRRVLGKRDRTAKHAASVFVQMRERKSYPKRMGDHSCPFAACFPFGARDVTI